MEARNNQMDQMERNAHATRSSDEGKRRGVRGSASTPELTGGSGGSRVRKELLRGSGGQKSDGSGRVGGARRAESMMMIRRQQAQPENDDDGSMSSTNDGGGSASGVPVLRARSSTHVRATEEIAKERLMRTGPEGSRGGGRGAARARGLRQSSDRSRHDVHDEDAQEEEGDTVDTKSAPKSKRKQQEATSRLTQRGAMRLGAHLRVHAQGAPPPAQPPPS